MTEVGRTRVAAYALCLDEAGRILLCRISPSVIPGEVWTLPGGGMDFGEAPEAAVLRELSEETGQTGEILGLADVSDGLIRPADRPEPIHAIRIVYRVRITGGELRHEADGTTDMCAWFTPAEARLLNMGNLATRALDLLAGDVG